MVFSDGGEEQDYHEKRQIYFRDEVDTSGEQLVISHTDPAASSFILQPLLKFEELRKASIQTVKPMVSRTSNL